MKSFTWVSLFVAPELPFIGEISALWYWLFFPKIISTFYIVSRLFSILFLMTLVHFDSYLFIGILSYQFFPLQIFSSSQNCYDYKIYNIKLILTWNIYLWLYLMIFLLLVLWYQIQKETFFKYLLINILS